VAGEVAGESVLDRTVRIFEAFNPEATVLSVSQIARSADLHVATASRLVAKLVDLKLLTREPDRRVRLGLRLWELASRASPGLTLRDAVMPFMEDVHDVVGQHTQLGVLADDAVLCLERLTTPNSVVNFTRIAGRLPLHASSSGLILLAHACPQLQERVLASRLHRYTARTVTDPVRLRSMLADIRREGFVVCPGYIDPAAAGVAVPVRDAGGDVVAALAVIVPAEGPTYEHVPVLRTASRAAERGIAARAG
jgi:DNA-binding IclR family transcriptional regulator